MKINIGCGDKKLEGYTNVDANPDVIPDVLSTADRLEFCGSGEADEIRMDAVYEHLYLTERIRALREWMRCLKPNGVLAINWVPDFGEAMWRYDRHELSMRWGNCGIMNCGPTDEFPHFTLAMMERITHGAAGLHAEKPFQLHKSLFTKVRMYEELTQAGFVLVTVDRVVYPGERGSPYNLCAKGVRP